MTEDGEIRYRVVVRDQMGDLEQRVNGLMRKGWHPTGGVTSMTKFYSSGAGKTRFIQAMILPQGRCTTTCVFDEEVSLMFAGSAT